MGDAISSRVMGLKFMQRAMEKKNPEQKQAPEPSSEHWVAKPDAAPKGCVVLLEGDPPATSGRMSFMGFTTAPETAYQKTGARQVSKQEGVSVADDDMASRLAKKKDNKKEGGAVEEQQHKRKDKEGKRREQGNDVVVKKKKKKIANKM